MAVQVLCEFEVLGDKSQDFVSCSVSAAVCDCDVRSEPAWDRLVSEKGRKRIGSPVPLFAQKKSIAGEQGKMSHSLVRRGVSDHVQLVASVGQTFDGSRPLMDLSPLVVLPDAVNGPSTSQSLKLLTEQTPRAVVQQIPLPNASNISLQGLMAQQLSEWLDSLNTPQNTSKGEEWINRVRLATEVTELVGMMGVNRLESYTEEELRYLCPRITKEVSKIHQKLSELADNHDIEIEKAKHLKRSYRLDFEAKDFEHMRFVEGLRPEIGQMIKSHLICWQAKLIDEVLQYAQYCSDEIELKQKKLKEKATVMQIKAAQTGTNSDDEEEQTSEIMNNNVNVEYPLIEFFPMFTVKELHADLQGTVQENVWDLTGKEVCLIKGVELIKITLKANVVFPQLPNYNMAQDVLMKVAQIIGDFLKQGILKDVLSSPCNSPMMGLKKPCGKVRIVQDLQKVNDMVVKCCPVVPNPH
ncbi:hypothetical protein NDU88_004338 [Pleurodeles waltl]|uniref:Uncharacterized protein n=1 Tax=Pleurodeles waltl TaxID=8319 RepID=A0AAV7VKF1_PLEWA|nr:hypothetical protein NDU88_004338 [Pleurodeles waltl]